MDQFSSDDPPGEMVVGEAPKESITGGVPEVVVTVTVAEAATEPEPLVAVIVYVVVAAGVIVLEPEAETAPMPWLMETVLAPVTVHDNVVDCPDATEAGTALKKLIAG
jgi:hypothetical protein